jgi:hypothetical protein
VCANVEHAIAFIEHAQQKRDLRSRMCPKLADLMCNKIVFEGQDSSEGGRDFYNPRTVGST